MFRSRSALMICVIALSAIFTRTAAADAWNKKTVVTFSAPVEIPGKVLPAGTYVFKIADVNGDRNIVQIFNQDQDQLYATIMGLPDYRLNTPEKTIIDFDERPVGTPVAIKEWFYPGDNYGVEFVYPHDEAVRIARRTHQSVLAMRNDMEKSITAPASTANGQSMKDMENTDVTGVDASGNQIDTNQVVSPKRQK